MSNETDSKCHSRLGNSFLFGRIWENIKRGKRNLLKWWNNRTHVYQNWSMDRPTDRRNVSVTYSLLFNSVPPVSCTLEDQQTSNSNASRITAAVCKNVFTLFSMKMWFMQKWLSCFESWMCVCWLGCWTHAHTRAQYKRLGQCVIGQILSRIPIIQYRTIPKWKLNEEKREKMRTNKWTNNNYAPHEYYDTLQEGEEDKTLDVYVRLGSAHVIECMECGVCAVNEWNSSFRNLLHSKMTISQQHKCKRRTF